MNSAISGRDDAGAGVCWEGSLLMAPVYTDLRAIGGPARCLTRLFDNVVDLQRLVHDRLPFGAGGGAALAVFRQRQAQRSQQRIDLLSRGQMRQVRPGAERRLVQFVEGGQPAREKFAV